jgi:hypothetical protein
VIHHTTPHYWECYHSLPEKVQKIADKNYLLLKQNPKHPSLHFKKLKDDLWSVRITQDYRALATEVDHLFLWFWIGSHKEYEHLTKH